MLKYGLTNLALRSFALRGEESVKPGRKLLLVHVSPRRNYAIQVTALTGIIELSGAEMNSLSGFSLYGDKSAGNMYKVFLYRDKDGVLGYRHATDAGILTYGEGPSEFWNVSNFTVDKKMLKGIGIKVEGF